ncbi:hypothetical protein HGI30_19650 [Paenibacillus albicereus]|uniref:Uncharacterized protein n=1 Tax=Paenibacillus albicereus TaxID=2726185 RepID=A0A6H2GRU9_9BACL|nr:hypothetical protein [Paenibacillus albicereus]QJC50151.1 hypothetical protein HGI30_19650 [Paenibacillus albicereus]
MLAYQVIDGVSVWSDPTRRDAAVQQEVLDAHAGTVEVLHRLRPIRVCMPRADEHDPYKD